MTITDRAELRLAILTLLRQAPGYTSNQVALARALRHGGAVLTQDSVRTEMAWLDNVGAVVNRDVDGVFVATLTLDGDEHLLGARAIPGVARPAPGRPH